MLAVTSMAQFFKRETVGHSSDSLERLFSSAVAYTVAIWEGFACPSAFRGRSLMIRKKMEAHCLLVLKDSFCVLELLSSQLDFQH